MKRIFLVLIIVVTMISDRVYAKEPEAIGARGAVLMHMETGRVLYAKDKDLPLAVASTTKIMTALLAIESGRLDETLVVSQNAASAPQVKLGIQKGEEYIVRDLLYPLMLESSNDVAVAIGEHIGGSVEGFAKMMNARGREIGAQASKFVTPNGLDKDGNQSTAYDMALITCEALKNEEFKALISTPSYNLSSTSSGRHFSVANKNRLLREYTGALGVKTGFTGLAGHCFVGAAKKGDITLVSVVLGSGWGNAGKEKKWTDTKKLLNYGFENFSMEKVLDKEMLSGKTVVLHSQAGEVRLITKEDGYALVKADEIGTLKVRGKVKESVEAPIEKGQVLGAVWVETQTGEILFTTDLVAEIAVDRKTMNTSAKKIINYWLNFSFTGIMMFSR